MSGLSWQSLSQLIQEITGNGGVVPSVQQLDTTAVVQEQLQSLVAVKVNSFV